jgi:hypothetical protein
MVKEKDVWSAAYADKIYVDQSFERVKYLGNAEHLFSAMDLCDKAEWKLILIERKIREEKLRANPCDIDDYDRMGAIKMREFLINQLEGITGKNIQDILKNKGH